MGITEQVVIQLLSVCVNVALLVAVVRATRSITRLEFKVEMMWDIFSKEHGLGNPKDQE